MMLPARTRRSIGFVPSVHVRPRGSEHCALDQPRRSCAHTLRAFAVRHPVVVRPRTLRRHTATDAPPAAEGTPGTARLRVLPDSRSRIWPRALGTRAHPMTRSTVGADPRSRERAALRVHLWQRQQAGARSGLAPSRPSRVRWTERDGGDATGMCSTGVDVVR